MKEMQNIFESESHILEISSPNRLIFKEHRIDLSGLSRLP